MNTEDIVFVAYADIDLSRDAMTASDEFPLQRHHVNVLKKAEAECVVDLEERPNSIRPIRFIRRIRSNL